MVVRVMRSQIILPLGQYSNLFHDQSQWHPYIPAHPLTGEYQNSKVLKNVP